MHFSANRFKTFTMKTLLFIFFFPSLVFAQNPQLIQWFAGADLIGTGNSQEELSNDFFVREFELSAFSQIDHIWQGSLTMSMHKDAGSIDQPTAEVHEAFLFSNQAINNTNIKIGRFFLGFGRLNRFHRHDWALSEAPTYHEEFFGEEAVRDEGIEVSKLLATDFYLDLTMGITSGKEFVHSHSESHSEEEEDHEEVTPQVPTHYLRLASFTEFSTQKGIEYALNYVGRTDNEGVKSQYIGFDLIYKNKFSKFYKDLLQFEVWNRTTEEEGEIHNDIGGYLYYEKGFDQNHALGLLVDWYTPEGAHEEEEEEEHSHGFEVEDYFTEVGMVYSYYNSEFMRTRLTLSHGDGLIIDERRRDNTKLLLQMVFTIGAHPAHVY